MRPDVFHLLSYFHKRAEYTVIKADCFFLFLVFFLNKNLFDTSNGQVLSAISLISGITMGLMTTPRYTGVNACLCHSQTIQPHPPSPLHTEQCHCNVIQRSTAASFVPALDMDLNLPMKPAALVRLSLRRQPHYNMYNYTLIPQTYIYLYFVF